MKKRVQEIKEIQKEIFSFSSFHLLPVLALSRPRYDLQILLINEHIAH